MQQSDFILPTTNCLLRCLNTRNSALFYSRIHRIHAYRHFTLTTASPPPPTPTNGLARTQPLCTVSVSGVSQSGSLLYRSPDRRCFPSWRKIAFPVHTHRPPSAIFVARVFDCDGTGIYLVYGSVGLSLYACLPVSFTHTHTHTSSLSLSSSSLGDDCIRRSIFHLFHTNRCSSPSFITASSNDTTMTAFSGYPVPIH